MSLFETKRTLEMLKPLVFEKNIIIKIDEVTVLKQKAMAAPDASKLGTNRDDERTATKSAGIAENIENFCRAIDVK